jgi:hypothetical protein
MAEQGCLEVQGKCSCVRHRLDMQLTRRSTSCRVRVLMLEGLVAAGVDVDLKMGKWWLLSKVDGRELTIHHLDTRLYNGGIWDEMGVGMDKVSVDCDKGVKFGMM